MQRTFIYKTDEIEKSVMIYRILAEYPDARIKSKVLHGLKITTDIHTTDLRFDDTMRKNLLDEFDDYPKEAGYKLKAWFTVVIDGLPDNFNENVIVE